MPPAEDVPVEVMTSAGQESWEVALGTSWLNKIGIVVLSNAFPTGVPDALCDIYFDNGRPVPISRCSGRTPTTTLVPSATSSRPRPAASCKVPPTPSSMRSSRP